MTPGNWIHGFVLLILIGYIIYASGALPKVLRIIFLTIFASMFAALIILSVYAPEIVVDIGDTLTLDIGK